MRAPPFASITAPASVSVRSAIRTLAITAAAVMVMPAVASPCTVTAFDSCYIGVDGTDARTLDTVADAYDFVGLGVRSIDPLIPPNAPFAGDPSGTLTVATGGVLTLNYKPGTIGPPTIRPLDNSVLVGVSLHSVGVLNVDGGTVTTPILFAGQGDNARPSTGTVTISNGGTLTASLDSTAGPLPGFPALGIGRGLGSVGTVNVVGSGSTLSAAQGAASIGREGTGTLNVLDGGLLTLGGTLFGSTISATGSSTITVDGANSRLDNGTHDILLGISTTLLAADPNHGSATLDVRNGGEVVGNITVGTGGTLRGNGTLTGNVTNLGGTVAPGNSPGTLHIDGALHQVGGILDIEVASTGLFDSIDASGDVTLEDVLIRFVFLDGFAPSAGDSFDFLRAGTGFSLANLNPTFDIVGLQPGFDFAVTSNDGVLALSARNNGVSVPAPGALALLALACVGLKLPRRKVLGGV